MRASPTANSITHVVFDWDGTLDDNVAAVHGAGMAIADDFGLRKVDLAYFRAHVGRNWRAYFDELRSMNGEPPFTDSELHDFLQEWDRQFEIELSRARPMDDALTALQTLADANICCSVCSMHNHERLLDRAKRFNLDSYFVRIDGLSQRDSGVSKIDHLRQHLDALNLGPHAANGSVALIGDTDDDARAAQRLHLETLIVTRGQLSKERLAELIPDVPRFDSLSLAVKAVLGLNPPAVDR